MELVSVVLACVVAQVERADKSGYSLLDPTPRELMREMSTDRPDATESPYTVDAGHFQVELSFVAFEREKAGARVDTVTIAPVNFKVGVRNDVDVQFIFDPFIREDTEGGGSLSGIGDLTIRTKVNLIGNDQGGLAIAVMPFVKIPTGGSEVSNGAMEGGLIVPVSIALPQELSLGLMLEIDAVRNDTSGYEAEVVHTAVLGRTLVAELAGFVEYVGVSPLYSGGDYRASFNMGLTYGLTPDLQLDGGVSFGLTEAAPDFGAFIGLSWRY